MLPQVLPNIPPVLGASVPSWVLRGNGLAANVDLNFAAGLYYGGSLGALLSNTNSTGGYVTNSDGSLTLFAPNTPRIGIGTGLLVEEARTNLLNFSNAPNSFSVPQSGCTAVANITDPALVANNAWTITQTGANGSDSRYQNNLTIANDSATYTITAYVLKQTGTPAAYPCLQMTLSGGAALVGGAVLDTVNGVAQTNGGAVLTGLSVVSSGAFWRVSFAFANNTSGNTSLLYQFYPAWNAAYSGTKSTVLNGANGFAFGQAEIGSFSTSYIPTTTVAVTRAGDNVVSTGSLLALLSASSGTAVLSLSPFGGSSTVAVSGTVLGSTSNNTIGRYPFNTTDLQAWNGAINLRLNVGSAAFASNMKTAIGWGVGRTLAGNGSVVSDANSITLPSPYLGSTNGTQNLDGYILRLSVWNLRFPDATLQVLTT